MKLTKKFPNFQISKFFNKNLSKSRFFIAFLFCVVMLEGCNKSENFAPESSVNTGSVSNGRAESEPFLLKYENLHPKVKESFVYYDAKNGFLLLITLLKY